MLEKINEEVSVVMYYNAKQKLAQPHIIRWKNQDYQVSQIGYHHAVQEGKTLHHIFELTDNKANLWFRLNFNTANLHWLLEAISDGLNT